MGTTSETSTSHTVCLFLSGVAGTVLRGILEPETELLAELRSSVALLEATFFSAMYCCKVCLRRSYSCSFLRISCCGRSDKDESLRKQILIAFSVYQILRVLVLKGQELSTHLLPFDVPFGLLLLHALFERSFAGLAHSSLAFQLVNPIHEPFLDRWNSMFRAEPGRAGQRTFSAASLCSCDKATARSSAFLSSCF